MPMTLKLYVGGGRGGVWGICLAQGKTVHISYSIEIGPDLDLAQRRTLAHDSLL